MAITNVIAPALLNFAGNPIVVKATTDQSVAGTEKSHLRIVCQVWVKDDKFDTDAEELYFELSQPVPDRGTATFNLKDCVMAKVNRIHSELDMNAPISDNDETCWSRVVKLRIRAQVYDVFLFDNQEVRGSVVAVKPTASSSVMYAVPGRLTDFEMMKLGSVLLEGLSSNKPMSRKPDMGVVYRGETVIYPVVTSSAMSSELSASVGGTRVAASTYAFDSYSLEHQSVTINHGADGALTVTSTRGGTKSGYYRANNHGVHFLRFINGFGAVENIAVRAKDKLSYEVSGETHSLVQEISTRPTDRRYATKSQPVGVYELSSGYVPVRWAEWYVQELLTSPRVWIQLGGKWVPALIEAEDDCVIYDRTKPEMPHVDFTLRLAIDGVTGCTW